LEIEKLNMRQEQAAETKKKLLESAQKLFAAGGYKGTPERRINRDIGMADGLLYHYFPGGKIEILQVLVQENFKQFALDLRMRTEGLDEFPIEEAIEQLYQNWNEVFAEHHDVLKILFKENEVMELVDKSKLAEIFSESGRWFPGFLEKRAKAGEIRNMDFDSATEALKAIVMNHFVAMLVGVGPGCLSNPAHRKRLIAYQVNLWKNPLP